MTTTTLSGCPCNTSRRNPYSLTKYSRPRTFPSPKVNIVLPQGNIKVPFSTIYKHVPGGYEKFKSANLGRNVDPLQDLRLFIQSGEELEVLELAMQWIFSHVKVDKTLQCAFHMRTLPNTENPLEQCMLELDDAFSADDGQAFMTWLYYGDSIVRAICFVLQGPWFGNSYPLNEALVKAVVKLLPYYAVGGADGADLYSVIEAAGKAIVDWRALGDLIKQLQLNERQAVQIEVYQRASQGEQFAINILPYI